MAAFISNMSRSRIARIVVAALALAATTANASQRESIQSRLSPPIIHAAPANQGPDDFKAALSIVLNRMMVSYQGAVNQPIRIDVLDTSLPEISKFVQGVSRGAYDPHTVLAMNYDANAKFNGKRTAACMVQYNSAKRHNLLSGYEHSRIFNKQEILYYMAAHEFGHCMAFHQATLGNSKGMSTKEHELLADRVAVAFFMVNERPESAERTVEFNRKLVVGEMHSHPDALEAFHSQLKRYFTKVNPREVVKSMLDVYQIASGEIDIS